MTQTTAPPPDAAIGAPPTTSPLVRPLAFPIQEGMLWSAGLTAEGQPIADEFEAEWLRVTSRGHWFMSEDQSDPEATVWRFTRCRGCGAVGEFAFELDEQRCPHPATAQSIASALLASMPRPAPATPRRYYLRTWREGLVSE